MYNSGMAFYTRDSIRSLEFQIFKNAQGETEEKRNTFFITGIDQSEYPFAIPEGNLRTNEGTSFVL